MTRRSRLYFAGLLTALLVAPTAAGADGPTLSESHGSRFPDREFVLTLPSKLTLDPAAAQVSENGRPVSRFAIVPAAQTGRENEFGVVLVIDASNSMRGKPIRGALAAAREFALHRYANQRLGVITFNQASTVRLALTADSSKIAAALSSTPTLARSTHLYDAVDRAIDVLSSAGVRFGSVVVLSDGADTGSTATAEGVAAAARRAHVRIFSVALKSPTFRATPLHEMADVSGGAYVDAASPKELTPIYGQLGSKLASEYVVRYRSLEGPGQSVYVEVRSRQFKGAATARYTTPKLSAGASPYHPSAGLTFWSSAAAAVVISTLVGGLVAFALVWLVRPRNRSLRDRLSAFVSLGGRDAAGEASHFPDKFFTGAEKSLLRMQWWPRFQRELELARIRMPAIQVVLWTVVGTVFALWLLYTISGSKLLALIAFGVPITVRAFVRRRADAVRARFAEQLPDNLQVLASALRAGHSLVGALSVVVDDAPEPARSEFQHVIADEQLGVPLEQSLLTVADRMENRDLEQVALVAALQRRTGGNTAEVLDQVTATIRERFELRRLVKTLTAQGRLSRWVVSFLPFGLLLAILAINPRYVKPLFTHGSGRILVGVAAMMVVLGSVVIGRIVKIKV